MPSDLYRGQRRFLEPNDRISELLFGLIMVLTFTGSLSVAEAGRDDVRAMLVGALGCNFAWGVIDAIFYLMGTLAEKGTGLATIHAARRARDSAEGTRRIAEALPPVVASILGPDELAAMHRRLLALPEPPPRARLLRADWLAALGVFLFVFLTTFPVAIPFLYMDDLQRAMRWSNGIAMALLFLAGLAYGRIVGRSPWKVGLSMVALGGVLVAMTIALGG